MAQRDIAAHILDCTACELHRSCTLPVPMSTPDPPTDVAIVGEAPGAVEDQRGLPFIGPAGQHLRTALTDVGFDPDTLAYLNTVSCYPAGSPKPEHIEACATNKTLQLDEINPRFVLLAGSVALRATCRDLSIRHGRGRPFISDGRCCYATYHPSAALRNGTYDKAMRLDLERFHALVAMGAEHWEKMIPDSCAGCPVEAEWWDERGLGWCPLHVPDASRQAYETRQELLASELDAARRRLVEVT